MPNLGDVAGAAENYRRMQSIFEQLLAENPSDLEQRHSVAIGLEKLGRMEAARGNLPGALNFYRQELAGFQQVASAQPGNVQYRRDLTVGYGDVGEALWKMRRIPAALQNLRQMLAIREELFAVDPTNAAAFGDLQRGLQFLSTVMANAGALGEIRNPCVACWTFKRAGPTAECQCGGSEPICLDAADVRPTGPPEPTDGAAVCPARRPDE